MCLATAITADMLPLLLLLLLLKLMLLLRLLLLTTGLIPVKYSSPLRSLPKPTSPSLRTLPPSSSSPPPLSTSCGCKDEAPAVKGSLVIWGRKHCSNTRSDKILSSDRAATGKSSQVKSRHLLVQDGLVGERASERLTDLLTDSERLTDAMND